MWSHEMSKYEHECFAAEKKYIYMKWEGVQMGLFVVEIWSIKWHGLLVLLTVRG